MNLSVNPLLEFDIKTKNFGSTLSLSPPPPIPYYNCIC